MCAKRTRFAASATLAGLLIGGMVSAETSLDAAQRLNEADGLRLR